MARNMYSIGFVIFIVIMLSFFILNIFFRNVEYYSVSILMNAFFVPFVSAVGAYISVVSYSKFKKKLTFKEAFGRAFTPMFVGGALSMASIFLYISFIDKDTKDLLNYQYIESYKKSLEEEYTKVKQIVKPNTMEMNELEKKYAEGKLRIQAKESKNEDMFSLQYFTYVFAGFCVFYIVLSLFFGSFFRTRTEQ